MGDSISIFYEDFWNYSDKFVWFYFPCMFCQKIISLEALTLKPTTLFWPMEHTMLIRCDFIQFISFLDRNHTSKSWLCLTSYHLVLTIEPYPLHGLDLVHGFLNSQIHSEEIDRKYVMDRPFYMTPFSVNITPNWYGNICFMRFGVLRLIGTSMLL